jgi:GGDEF domain-containing protein
LSFSFGVASFDPSAPVSMEQLLVEADARMYEAKLRRGRARTSPLVFATDTPARTAQVSVPVS